MIIITRPKPAYGRQSLEGGIAGHDTDQAVTFWGVLNVSLRAYGAQASLVVMVFHGSRLVFHGSCSFCHDSRLVLWFVMVPGPLFMVPGWFQSELSTVGTK